MSCRCYFVWHLLERERRGGCLASGSKVTALSKWSCAASRREHEMAMVQSFRRLHTAANVVASVQSAGVSAKAFRNSVEDASTLKLSCRRDSRFAHESSWDGEARSQKRRG